MGRYKRNQPGKVLAQLKGVSTYLTTYDLQEKSHYAAKVNLKKRERKTYTPPSAEEIFAMAEKGASHKTAGGHLPFILHVGPKRVFVSKSFTPFGASQKSIARELGVSDRTVRRHLSLLGIESRQIVQAKAIYKKVVDAIEHDASYFRPVDDLCLLACGNDYELQEHIHNGKQWQKTYVNGQRFFTYFGQTWLYRCNLYNLSLGLCSMRAARKLYRKEIAELAPTWNLTGYRAVDGAPPVGDHVRMGFPTSPG